MLQRSKLYPSTLLKPSLLYSNKNCWVIFISPWYHFLFLFFYLEDNCFTMFWWSLPYINSNQSYSYIYISSFWSLPPLISFSNLCLVILKIHMYCQAETSPCFLWCSWSLFILGKKKKEFALVLMKLTKIQHMRIFFQSKSQRIKNTMFIFNSI